MFLFYIIDGDSLPIATDIFVCLQDITTITDPYADIAPAGTITVCLQDISGLP